MSKSMTLREQMIRKALKRCNRNKRYFHQTRQGLMTKLEEINAKKA